MNKIRWEIIDPDSLEIVGTVTETGEVSCNNEVDAILFRDMLSRIARRRWGYEDKLGRIFDCSERVYPSTMEHTNIVMYDSIWEHDYLLRWYDGDKIVEIPPTPWEKARHTR